ncbi:MAG: RT0821/Lpp0805 family surface protein [Desulfobacteria bacterium]|nr:RT0821/Lpp0805 family surface protein [Deltaproteobacteria bacterium]HQT96941.1 RT0821/Lpp0805 family surface protein [Thermodesulfobacteriota bacterium]
MKKKGLFLFLILALTSYGCATTMGPKETGGTVIGGVGGAIIGSQVGGGTGRLVGVAIGTLAGALIGQEVGRSLDRADRLAMENTAQQALEYNQAQHASAWRNPDTGHSGTITPTRTYRGPAGRYCREYVQTVMIGGEQHKAYGTACRKPDGTWKIVNK